MVMYRDQPAGQSTNIKINNSSLARVEEFRYLGATITNQNSIQEEIKSTMKSGNACYYLVQHLLSYEFAIQKFKDQDIQNYNTVC
jgi:hypothetical protein